MAGTADEQSTWRLPGVVQAGWSLALLAAIAAVVLLFLPVTAPLNDTDYSPDGAGQGTQCGSVLLPADDDALTNAESPAGPACSSARVQRAGWAGTALGGSVIVLVLSALAGEGRRVPGGDGPHPETPPDRDGTA